MKDERERQLEALRNEGDENAEGDILLERVRRGARFEHHPTNRRCLVCEWCGGSIPDHAARHGCPHCINPPSL